MRYTNRDLIAVRKVLEAEIVRLKIVRRLPGGAADAIRVNEKLAKLNRDRVALCAAVVHRRSEASKHVVSFSRWVSGNGAIDGLDELHVPSDREGLRRFRASAPHTSMS